VGSAADNRILKKGNVASVEEGDRAWGHDAGTCSKNSKVGLHFGRKKRSGHPRWTMRPRGPPVSISITKNLLQLEIFLANNNIAKKPLRNQLVYPAGILIMPKVRKNFNCGFTYLLT